MWPWEHAIVGYLAYSVGCHLVFRDSPSGLEAFAVVLASTLPDLIDKPLAWEYGVFDSGYAVGHSVFFIVPLSVAIAVIAYAIGRPRTGLAFGVGALLHPPADVLYSYVSQGIVQFELMLWPVVTVPGSSPSRGFLESFDLLFGRYLSQLLAGDISTYVWLQFGLAAFAFLLWLYDGLPVLRECLVGWKRLLPGPSNSSSK
ncbi:metal-dependent hydrolase [Natrinema halophilum]|uniref:Metal-dependent hydrolase n=1 Tax=Natrinema halophilum TaxID=1699371 RepID=A0A7D5H543_9EURY|nr:metal-dependent hydrolase [Natrinema halophilum]QLG47755.1 metal-dependent hydrolase [Natrinema halophilum]